MREPTPSERKLVEIATQLATMYAIYLKDKYIEEVVLRAADQLNQCGFKNTPVDVIGRI